VGRPRVAFFAHLPFHRPILEPIRDVVADGAECLLSHDRREIVTFAPHVLVMTSHAHLEHFRHRLPGTLTVNVRHGLIGKRVVARLPERRSARTFDFVCIGVDAALESAGADGAREHWATGYVQLDPLFRRDPPPALPLDPTRKTVIYAPTWNLGLSSADMLGPRLVELIRGGGEAVNVVIKPHPVIGDWRPRWMSRWASLAARDPNVHLVRDTHADVTPYLLAADVLVSDASSVVFEFLALDRPIILVTNPRHAADPAYDRDSIVWTWRDVGDEIHDVAKLPAAVAAALGGVDAHGEQRRRYARLLFGPFTDGRNHVRIGEKILETATARAGDPGPPAGPPIPASAWFGRASLELRTRLATSPFVRRVALGPLEGVRLRLRERRGRR
jgi:hypothetical protein